METLKIRGKFLRHRLENGPLYPEIADQLTQDEMLIMSSNLIEQIEDSIYPDQYTNYESGEHILFVFETLNGSYGVTIASMHETGYDIHDDGEYELQRVTEIQITTTQYIYG